MAGARVPTVRWQWPLRQPSLPMASARDMGPRLLQVHELRRLPLHELVPRLVELRADEAGPVRKVIAEFYLVKEVSQLKDPTYPPVDA